MPVKADLEEAISIGVDEATYKSVNFLQSLKARFPIEITDSGIFILVSSVQLLNAELSIDVISDEIKTDPDLDTIQRLIIAELTSISNPFEYEYNVFSGAMLKLLIF